jgi:23S rRNA pseudouridine2457 synthase
MEEPLLIALNKPYGCLSQFTPEPGSKWGTLALLKLPSRIYPIGRLDADSEGLLLLSDEKQWVDRLLNPQNAHTREYWVQVERIPTPAELCTLARGLPLDGTTTRPCKAKLLEPQPSIPLRVPPIRFRKTVPDCWISLELIEGKNRQVRRMTAAIGHPTLRLLRVRIGELTLAQLDLEPGRWRELDPAQRLLALGDKHRSSSGSE